MVTILYSNESYILEFCVVWIFYGEMVRHNTFGGMLYLIGLDSKHWFSTRCVLYRVKAPLLCFYLYIFFLIDKKTN